MRHGTGGILARQVSVDHLGSKGSDSQVRLGAGSVMSTGADGHHGYDEEPMRKGSVNLVNS